MKKICFSCCILLLTSCDKVSKFLTPQSPYENFYDQNLMFDLDHETQQVSCKIQGNIPDWLSGTLLRNGPAKFSVDGKRVNWFDGLAMLHAFDFSSSQVLYTNRFIRSEQYYIMMDEKSLNFAGFAQDPCSKLFKNHSSRFIPNEMKGVPNADVTIQQFADKMVALTEVPLPVIFDSKTLETLGLFHYQDQLPQGQWVSAHSLRDPISGETVNYCVQFGEKSSYIVWKMKEGESSRKIITEIPVDLPAYMHSFALTENYVILVEFPFVVNPVDLVLKKKPFIFNYKWVPEKGTHFFVINRHTGEVKTIKGDPFFAFHHVNAFDKEGKIFIDIVTHPNADIIEVITDRLSDKKKIAESQKTTFERFVITLSNQNLVREILYNQTTEMPRVPEARVARQYRYAYLIEANFPTAFTDAPCLYKVDTISKSAMRWSQPGCYPGEPVFVPKPNSQEEDEGVILSLVLDFANHRSFLLILDAKDFHELARAETPYAIPIGLHGWWKS